MPNETPVRVLVTKEGDSWTAQCVDYDIGAQAKDLDTLRGRLEAVLLAELNESVRRSKTNTPFDGIPKAPPHYAEVWAKTSNRLVESPRLQRSGEQEFPHVELALCA